MAEFNEIEDLRDWFVDLCGEFLGKVDVLNGEEPAALLETVQREAESMHQAGIKVIAGLDALLVAKKRAEES